ncbi:hypothetical protein ACGFJ7_22810 [Actinoplanes sp. NPDC048988]|uniref:hypothetical protein n=1 Tax=Actinoplanes sp. NPDC048988 TaxID=3363901 RepID=UPI003720134A
MAALAVVAAPMAPAAARESRDASGKCAGLRPAVESSTARKPGDTPAGEVRADTRGVAEKDQSVDRAGTRFTAVAQADLVKVSVLDAGVLRPGLPSLADVRLGSAHGRADSAACRAKTSAAGRYADAKLLGMQLPGLPAPGTAAQRQAPPSRQAATAELAGLRAAGLATVQLGRSTAEARWLDTYNCGATGPLTRTATMLAGVQLLSGGGRTPALQALRRPGDTARKTSLLRLGPTGSTQSATDVVRLDGGHRGVSAAAGVALSDLTLFGGTPQEVSIKVVTQPTLTVVAAGDRERSSVAYRPAVLKVTAAGKPVATLDTAGASVGVDLFGSLAPEPAAASEHSPAAKGGSATEGGGSPDKGGSPTGGGSTAKGGSATEGRSAAEGGSAAGVVPSLLSARISLGGPRQVIGDRDVRAEAAALRVEVLLGKAHLLDVALGYLYAQASTTPAKAKAKAKATAKAAGTPAATTRPGRTTGALGGEPGAQPHELPRVAGSSSKPVGRSGTAEATEVADSTEVSALARTGNNVFAVVTGGAVLLILGIAAVALARRRRQG